MARRTQVSTGRWFLAIFAGVGSVIAWFPESASATWSIVLVDMETKEVAAGSATCLTGFDLRQNLPVVIVGVGAACAQSAVDSSASNRIRIYEQFLNGTAPDEILNILEMADGAHQSRQYGIVDALGRAATFTGTGAGQHASGVTGQTGSIFYAIQGNVLTGLPVVARAQTAVINTDGDIPAKLMAGMEAARAMGGDGRCSCTTLDPTVCGAPPAEFQKSAHIGFMIVARRGDQNGNCIGPADGCANGSYFLNLNVANQGVNDLDPVLQLQSLYDTWLANRVGLPDALKSQAQFDRPWVRADFMDSATLTITLRDLDGNPPAAISISTWADHAPESDARTIPLIPTDLGGGVFSVVVGYAGSPGLDVFDVSATFTGGSIVIIPPPSLRIVAVEDIDADDDVDLDDQNWLTTCMDGPLVATAPGPCADADLDRGGGVDLYDYGLLQNAFTDSVCRELEFVQQPVSDNVCSGDPFSLTVAVTADPPPTYQWRRDGFVVPGATLPTFEVGSATEMDEGFYTCDVGNTCGVITSIPAVVRVVTEPIGPCAE